jgi:molybdenum cofactor cytidylyltransferase
MKNRVAGIILAAGDSTRFGKPKQLLLLNDEFIINRVIRMAANSYLDPIIVVLGANFDEINSVVTLSEKVKIVQNKTWKIGQSSSLIKGLNHIKNDNAAIMFLLGDQPFITSEVINELLSIYEKSIPDVVMLQTNGKRTPPIIFSQNCYGEIKKLEGDKGARDILHNFKVIFYENKDDLLITDIDTEKEFEALKLRIAINKYN